MHISDDFDTMINYRGRSEPPQTFGMCVPL